MNVVLYTLFIGLILLSLISSLTLKNISKREYYLTLCSDIALMMLGFYWKQKGLFFLVISFFVFLAAFFLIYYFRIYKELKSDDVRFIFPKSKLIGCLSALFFVIPMFVESDYIMLSLLIVFIIVERVIFFRKFRTLF